MPKANPLVVKPIIQIEGHKHALEKLVEAGKEPEFTGVGYVNLGQGQANNWVSYVIKTKGSKVVSIQVDEPNMRAVAEESFKINSANLFMSVE